MVINQLVEINCNLYEVMHGMAVKMTDMYNY